MKRLLIPFVAAFGLSLGIATGVTMMRAPKASPSSAAATGAAKKSGSPAAAKDSATAPLRDSAAAPDHAQATGDSTGDAKTRSPVELAANASKVETDTSAGKSSQSHSAPSSKAAIPNTKLASSVTAQHKPGPLATPISDSLIGRRLAQVFAAMQPKDAARVLEQMDDADVRAILGSLSSKQQAAILGSFPTQRAALIVQATLRTAASGGTE